MGRHEMILRMYDRMIDEQDREARAEEEEREQLRGRITSLVDKALEGDSVFGFRREELKPSEKLFNFNQEIVSLSEKSDEELDELYGDERVDLNIKEAIVAIRAIRWRARGDSFVEPERRFRQIDATEDFSADNNSEEDYIHQGLNYLRRKFYGLSVAEGREYLEHYDTKYKILTEEERRQIPGGSFSVEGMMSSALETFAMSPKYANEYIVDYEEFAEGILLDAAKGRDVNDPAMSERERASILDEFQARLVESMGPMLDVSDDKNEQIIQAFVRYRAGERYIEHDEHDAFRQSEPSIYEKLQEVERDHNREVFLPDGRKIFEKMREWAKKVDIKEVLEINGDASLSYVDKVYKIAAIAQQAFDVENNDGYGDRQPIPIYFFKPTQEVLEADKEGAYSWIDKSEDLPEYGEPAYGYYMDSERSIYLLRAAEESRSLGSWEIVTIFHEMWHARQYEVIRRGGGSPYGFLSSTSYEARQYTKNSMNYIRMGEDYPRYARQLIEAEAYALGCHIEDELRNERSQKNGRKLSRLFKALSGKKQKTW